MYFISYYLRRKWSVITFRYSVCRGRVGGRFYNQGTPTSDVLGIVSMSNWFYRRKTRSVPRLYFFLFQRVHWRKRYKKYQMLFLVLAQVHGRLSQQRLNLDLKKWKTVKKNDTERPNAYHTFLLLTVWDKSRRLHLYFLAI